VFRKGKPLDDGARRELSELHADVVAMTDLNRLLIDRADSLLMLLAEEAPELRPVSPYVEPEIVPESIKSEGETDDEARRRIRSSPYLRRPRHETVAWLLAEMKDGDWHTAIEIARRNAGEEREFRYLRHRMGHHLRELWEEGKLTRRSSEVKGAMFEYRVKRDGGTAGAKS
jgi:hypothetical protein